MKLLYNITPLLGEETGIGVYTRKIIEGIKAINSINSFGFFSNSKIYDNFLSIHKQDNQTNNISSLGQLKQLVYQYAPQIVKTSYTQLTEKTVARQLQKKYKGYIYHETNYNLLPFEGKKISTFHDLSILHFPEYHPIERIRYFEKHLTYTLENADHFITDSVFVKQEMIDLLGVKEDKISAIPLGVDKIFKPRKKEEILPTLRKYRLENINYFLIVGSFEPRKNIELLLDAYLQLPNAIKSTYKIVHVGPEGWNNKKAWKKALKLKERGQFIKLGYLSKLELAHVYNGATMFIFPSIYEGFGFPPLEAMASGVPVLSTDNSSLGEIVNEENAQIIKMQDSKGLKQKIFETILQIDSLRTKIENANVRSKAFNWHQTIQRTMDVYKSINLR